MLGFHLWYTFLKIEQNFELLLLLVFVCRLGCININDLELFLSIQSVLL